MADYSWFDFRNPDYDRIFKERTERLLKLRSNPALIAPLKEYYKNNPVDFICDWGMTSDPRNAEIGLPVAIPFILFDRQKEFVKWTVERWKNREDGLGEKSRDMGVTWLCVAVAVWMWSFYPDTVIGFGSRKEEYVDKIGDPKSIFQKIRMFISFLPKELRPNGFTTKCAPFMRILNPENGASIVGEAGDNIGRGNRTSIYFKDESAFYERPELIDAALSQTSNCKIDISTPNGNGNPFYMKRQKGRISLFSFHWTQDPRKDEAWYRKQQETLDPVILAQEVDIDYNASVTDAWIPGDIVEQAQNTGVANIEPNGQWIIGVDAAHFGDDESVIHMRRGRLNLPQKIHRTVDGVQLAALVTEEINNLTATGVDVYAVVIELDGAGVSCYDQLRQGKHARIIRGVHTGARTKDDKNYNLRAKMWREARDYLHNHPVSMPRDFDLKSQLSSLKYKYRDGLLLMQDKKEYKKDFGRSPDRADAFVLTFAIEEVVPKQEEHYYVQQHGWMG